MGHSELKQSQQLEKLIDDLKNLPKIETPPDFEYNLMVKIRNGQFEVSKSAGITNRVWRFIPATAFALSAVVITMIVFDSRSTDVDYLYLAEKNQSERIIEEQPQTVEIPVTENLRRDGYRVVVHPNDVVLKQKAPTFLDERNSVDLDKELNRSNKTSAPSNLQLTGSGSLQSRQNFGGFFRRVQNDSKELDRLRARMDSLTSLFLQQRR